MSPDDEVQITMTRAEVMRVEAALSALVSIANMAIGAGVKAAMGLEEEGALAAVAGVLPRFREHFPDGIGDSTEYVGMGADAKTYNDADVFEVKVEDLRNLTPDESAHVFATEYDESIRALLGTLEKYTDYSHEEFHQLLDWTKALLKQTMPIPHGLALKDSLPYVSASDLITLGALSHEMYKRQEQISANMDDETKPF